MSHLNDSPAILRIDAAGAVDARGLAIAPASVLLEFQDPARSIYPARVLAIGTPEQVDRHEASRSLRLPTIRRPDSILIPGLVNAHTHLDLTHIGPQPHDPARGFIPWVEMIRAGRVQEPEPIVVSVRRGIELSLAAGTVAVGDIAGAVAGRIRFEPWETLRASPLLGVSWLEFFGIGRGVERTNQMLDQILPNLPRDGTGRVRLGLQPHAPNTVTRSVYRRVAEFAPSLGHAAPLSTHLAETPEEREFVGAGSGAQRELLERFGLWDGSILADLGKGLHPVAHLGDVLAHIPFTVAHVNDADDAAIEVLARTRTRVVYCPRASEYFGVHRQFGAHRYREMLKSGVSVALGTDSLVNLPAQAERTPRESPGGRGMSILDEMRFLYRRDGTDAATLLGMGTVNGGVALGFEPEAFAFSEGRAIAGVVAVPVGERGLKADRVARAVMESDSAPELLVPAIDAATTV